MVRFLLPAFLCLVLPVRDSWAQIRLENPAQRLRLDVGGWVQLRYEYAFREGAEDLSSFYPRRLRLDLRGHAFAPELTFRINPEFAGTPSLRDAWVDYAVGPSAQIRFGQFNVPFQFYRYVSPQRSHFAERGVPSETFGFPAGRDVGVMLHGRSRGQRVEYGVGVFDGAGRNVQRSNSAGHMVTMRLTAALSGDLPREESDLARWEIPAIAVGLGVQAASRNEVRPWDLGRSRTPNRRADWISGTADGNVRWMGFSLSGDFFLRRVEPDAPDVDAYTGWAYTVSGGYFVFPGRIEVVGRFSELRLDGEDPNTSDQELGLGLNLYHFAHDVKTRVQYLTRRGRSPARFGQDAVLLIQVGIAF